MEEAPIKLEPLAGRRRGKQTPARAAGGGGLAERRKRNGVSLDDIAERTRIPRHHLEELERGDISQWPTGVYAKSWARDYAAEAGLDPDEVGALVAPVAEAEPSIEEIKEVREAAELRPAPVPRAFDARLWTRLAAVAVVIALLVLAGFFFSTYEPERRAVPQTVGTSGVSPEAPQSPVP